MLAERVGWSGSATWFRQNVARVRPDYAPTDPADRIVYHPGDQLGSVTGSRVGGGAFPDGSSDARPDLDELGDGLGGAVSGAGHAGDGLLHESAADVVRAGGRVLLLLVGGYVAYYGWWEIRVLRGAPTEDPVIEAAAAVQHWLANTATSIGAWGFALVLLGSIMAISLPRVGRRLLTRSRDASDAAHVS